MKGYDLIDALREDFRKRGTAAEHVFFKSEDGPVFIIDGTEREVDSDGNVTHWIVGTPY